MLDRWIARRRDDEMLKMAGRHDQAAAARAPVPEPAELTVDIDAVQHWVVGDPHSSR